MEHISLGTLSSTEHREHTAQIVYAVCRYAVVVYGGQLMIVTRKIWEFISDINSMTREQERRGKKQRGRKMHEYLCNTNTNTHIHDTLCLREYILGSCECSHICTLDTDMTRAPPFERHRFVPPHVSRGLCPLVSLHTVNFHSHYNNNSSTATRHNNHQLRKTFISFYHFYFCLYFHGTTHCSLSLPLSLLFVSIRAELPARSVACLP